MVLEAIEDNLRGWKDGKPGLGEERVARGKFAIEHVMPRKWHMHWPLRDGESEADRDHIIHTIGNLTLLTGKLNSKVSNGPWLGDGGKRRGLEDHDVLFLNRKLADLEEWCDKSIRARTSVMADSIVEIWPVPVNHRSGFSPDRRPVKRKVELADLIGAGVLQPGMSLFPRGKKYNDRVATLLPDGRIEIDETSFSSPSQAAIHIVGHNVNGWWFFLTNMDSRTSLRAVRRDYVDSMAVDVDDDDSDDEGDDDE
jgi:hypothetical protein